MFKEETPYQKKRNERIALIKEAQGIVKDTGVELSAKDVSRLEEIQAAVETLSDDMNRMEEGQMLLDRLNGLGDPDSPSAKDGRRQVLNLKSATRQLSQTKFGAEHTGVKALIAAGESVANLTFDPDPIAMGRPLDQVTDVLRLVSSTRVYSYLRQTVRTMNAAPVADGDLKPVSPITLERVEGTLKVIAHLSEPINKFWLEDNEALNGFIGAELVYGIGLELSDQILHGDGTGENFTGFSSTSGVQTQAFDTNLLLTTRQAVGKLETSGQTPGGFILHPADWMAIETATTTNGGFLLGDAGAPIDRVTRRLWGVPVVVSTTVRTGEGWLVGQDAAELRMDGGGIGDAATPRISAEWGIVGDDFQRNQLRARVEGRFDLAVTRPAAIVKMATVGTP